MVATESSVTIRALLAAPVLHGARLVTGGQRAVDRQFHATSVVEHSTTGFVIRPGELVLTTGFGLAEPVLERFLIEIMASQAVGLLVSLPPGGPVTAIPGEVLARARAAGFPVIELPWRIKFADVSRWVAEQVVLARVSAADDALRRRFSAVGLDDEGLDAIAAELEQVVERPALMLDRELQPIGAGPRARAQLHPERVAAHATALSREQARALAERLMPAHPDRVAPTVELGLGPGVAVAVLARHTPLGALYVGDRAGGEEPDDGTTERALGYAAIAAALNLRRRQAALRETSMAQERFLHELTTGAAGPDGGILSRAVLLGLDPRAPHELALARCGGGEDAEQLADALRARAARAGLTAWVSVHDDTLLAVVLRREEPQLAALVRDVHDRLPVRGRPAWGLASTARPLTELDVARGEAERALAVGERVRGPGAVGDANELAPFLMLAPLRDDPHVARIVGETLGALRAGSTNGRRNLLETLDVYLDAACNTSEAARRLFLSRHALQQRLRRIEQLTGRSLEQASDRFVLQLAVKLQRFGFVEDPPLDA
jgi:PucR family transcriptional regulator, purine catabolism regulatory protein